MSKVTEFQRAEAGPPRRWQALALIPDALFRCLRIVTKELRLLVADRYSLSLLLALPLVLVAILGMTTGELFVAHDESRMLKLDVVDLSQSALSQQVLRDLKKVGNLKLNNVASLPEARSRLLEGKASLIVTVGADFEDRVDDLRISDLLDPLHGKLERGLDAIDITVECSSTLAQTADLARYVVMAAVMRSILPEVSRKNRVIASFLERRAEAAAAEPENASTSSMTAASAPPPWNPMYQLLIPAYTVMFTFFIVNVMSMAFITERQLGTLRRLQMVPLAPSLILLGKTVPFVILSVIQSLILFGAGKLLFGMSWGAQPWALLPVIVCTSCAATGLGLLLSTLVETEAQVASYNSFLIVTMGGISGCFLPRDWLPEYMQQFSKITPHTWALIAYRELFGSPTPQLAIVWQCCGCLLGFAALFFALGWRRYQRLQ